MFSINNYYKHKLSDRIYRCLVVENVYVVLENNDTGNQFPINEASYHFYEPYEIEEEIDPDIGSSF